MALSTRVLSCAAVVAALAISACGTDSNNQAPFAVTGSSPTAGQTIGANAAVVVTFNRVPKTATATFSPDAGGTITGTINGAVASFAPTLAASTSYTVTVTATDTAGNGLATPFTLQFNTSAPDTIPPAAVTLALSGTPTATGLSLTFVASGDDGTTGTASQYELRYLSGSACPITSANFLGGAGDPGTLVTPISAPQAPGTTETIAVTGLSASTTYCFAIRVLDEVPNASPISNVVVAQTGTGPDTTPPAKPVLTTTSVTDTSIGLSWTASGDNGQTGTVATRLINFKLGAACTGFTATNFDTGTSLSLGAPAPGGSTETALATGLTAATTYCFIEKVQDAAGNAAFSDTLTVITAPATPAVTAAAVTPSRIDLHFTASRDGTTADGTAASYKVAFVGPLAVCPATEAAFVNPTLFTSVPTPSQDPNQPPTPGQLPPPDPPGTAETLPILGLQTGSHYCFAVQIEDHGNNSSHFSAVAQATTNGATQPPPSAITDLTAIIEGDTGSGASLAQKVQLNWSAPDTNDGQAAAAYSIRFATFSGATCPLTAGNVNSASQVPGPPVPQNPTSQQSFEASIPVPNDTTGICFAILSASSNSGFSAISNLAKPPLRITDVAGANIKDTTLDLVFTAPTYQTGTTATNYEVDYVPAGAGCPAFGSDIFNSDESSAFDGGPGTASTIHFPSNQAPLTPSTSYCFAVKAADTAFDESWSNVVLITTNAAPVITPPAPANLISTASTTSTISIQFDASFDDGAAQTGVSKLYTVFFGAAADCATFDPSTGTPLPLDETSAVTAAGQHVNTDITRLTAGTHYCVAVTATNAEGHTSPFSQVLAASTQAAGGGGGTPPGTIVDLRATVLQIFGSAHEDLTAVTTLTWTAPAATGGVAVGSYQILAGTNAGCPITADNVAAQTTLTDPAITPGAPGSKETFRAQAPIDVESDSVCFAIISKDSAGTASALSNVPLPPISVTDLNQGDATNDNSADLGMTQPAFQDGTTRAPFQYALAVALEGGGCPQSGDLVAALPGATMTIVNQLENQHQLPVTGLTPNTNYCIALLSADTDGDAAWSNPAPINTSDQSAPPPPPNVVVTGTTDTTISIQFDSVVDNSNAGTGVALKYDVVYAAVACSQFQATGDQSFDETGIITAPGQKVHVVLTGLTPSTQYCFFVNATNGGGQLGNGSDTFPAATQAPGGGGGTPPPAAITDLTARLEGDSVPPGGEGVNQQTAYLKWTAPADSLGHPVASYKLYSATDEGCPIVNVANATVIPNTLTPIGPGGTEGVEVQVVANDADDVCFAVTATDAAGNTSAISNIALPPHISNDLQATPGEPNDTAENLSFSTFFQTGTTQKTAIAFAAVATGSCSPNSSDFFNPNNIVVDASGGSALFTGLSPSTSFCVGVQLTSTLGDISFSLSTSFTTGNPPPPPDETPPGPVVIQALQPGDATSTGATLHWTAPADNGTDALSGKVASYSVYYVTVAQGSTDEACVAIDASTTGTLMPVQPTPSADPGTTETATIALAGSDKMPVCIAATATDAAGNTSARQGFKLITDTTAPAQVSPLTAQNITLSSVDLAFTDVGDDGTTGTAASFKVAFAVGACPGTFDFNNATLVTITAVPQAPGSSEVLTVGGLSYSQTYCFGLAVVDAAGNASPVATAQATTATPDVVGEITQLRADIAEGLPTTNDAVHGALVTYVKAAVGSAAIGTPDGEGFFIQPANTAAVSTPTAVPAIFVGADTSAISVGDLVDLTNITGLLAGCTTPPCTSSNGLEIATLGTAPHVASHNAPLPAVPDFSNLTPADWPAPINVGNWPFESNLVSLTGTITSPLSRNGFTGYFLSTAGVVVTGTNATDARFEFRIPTTLATTLGLPTTTAAGFNRVVQIKKTPVVRSETAVGAVTVEQVNPSAWVTADVALGPTDSFSPASGTITTTPTIAVTYSSAMDPSTVTGQSADGACSGSVQFSKDNFTTCFALTLIPSAGNTVFTLGLAKLADGTAYQLKTTSAAKDATNGLGASTVSTSYSTPAAGGVCTAVSPIIISQVYGGGGNSGSTFKQDFIELHNRSESDFTVPANWSVQYMSATGATGNFQVTQIPANTIIKAGGFFTIREAAGTGTTQIDVPADITTGTIPMAAGNGRVALVSGTTALSAVPANGQACPTQGQVVGSETVLDFVAFGSPNNCTNPTATLAAATSAQRLTNGCVDSKNNSTDFFVASAAPRSTAVSQTPPQFCSCDGSTKANGLGEAGGEIDQCSIDAPTAITGTHGATVGPSNGHFSETTLPEGAVIKGQVGYGVAGTDPFTQFAFTAGTAAANGTDYSASLTAPAAGSYSFLWRFSLDNGSHWTYCDINGAGANATNPFDVNNLGTLTSN
jgi:hypothetical protein